MNEVINMVMKSKVKRRNPLARELWSQRYSRTVENKLVYKRNSKHRLQDHQLVRY